MSTLNTTNPAFASLVNTSNFSVASNAKCPFNAAPSAIQNITYNGTDTLTITESGFYQLTYGGVAGAFNLSSAGVTRNNVMIPGSPFITTENGSSVFMTGSASIIVLLNATDTISLVNNSPGSVSFTNAGVGGQLNPNSSVFLNVVLLQKQ